MQQASNPHRWQNHKDGSMAYDVRLATRLTTPVDRRLRMLVLLKGQPLSHVLVSLLDKALPPADELASLLGDSGDEVAA